MASKPNRLFPESHGSAGSVPQLFMPPTARELRAQALHRLQIGLLGLCLMLLLVGLANIIMDRARMVENAASAVTGVPGVAPTAKSDPLADIGVVPSPEAAPRHARGPAATAAPANN